MKTMELDAATAPLADYAHHADDEPVVLTISGQPYAALLPIDEQAVRTMLHLYNEKLVQEERELDAEIEVLSNNPKFLALLEDAIASIKTEGTISDEEIRREFGLD